MELINLFTPLVRLGPGDVLTRAPLGVLDFHALLGGGRFNPRTDGGADIHPPEVFRR